MVLGEVLKEPDRELDLWPFEGKNDFFQSGAKSSDAMTIIGVKETYSTSSPIEISVRVQDPIFDCGDLYITIYDVSKNPKEVVTQSGFFRQCYNSNNLAMPIDDDFSETIDTPGQYEIEAEIYDVDFKKTLTSSEIFLVS